jgi:hypothetical protein
MIGGTVAVSAITAIPLMLMATVMRAAVSAPCRPPGFKTRHSKGTLGDQPNERRSGTKALEEALTEARISMSTTSKTAIPAMRGAPYMQYRIRSTGVLLVKLPPAPGY